MTSKNGRGGGNWSDEYAVVTSKRVQGMYFLRVQLPSSYLQPLSGNRVLKFLKNVHFGAFWPFLLHFGKVREKMCFY